jgi:chemotaxis protein histidine kinase CheA
MSKAKLDKVQKQLTSAIENDAPCTFEEEIPVLVTLDNGVKYKGYAFEVQPKTDNFPNGLVMVRTSNADIGVPVNYILGR